MPYVWIIGGLVSGLALIILSIVVCICLRSSNCFTEACGNSTKDPSGKNSHKFHILQKRSFCCVSGRYDGSKSGDNKQTTAEASHLPVIIPKGMHGSKCQLLLCQILLHIYPFIFDFSRFLFI